jgi:hypothetical protein
MILPVPIHPRTCAACILHRHQVLRLRRGTVAKPLPEQLHGAFPGPWLRRHIHKPHVGRRGYDDCTDFKGKCEFKSCIPLNSRSPSTWLAGSNARLAVRRWTPMVTIEIHAVAACRRSSVELPNALSGNAWTVYSQIEILASRAQDHSKIRQVGRASQSTATSRRRSDYCSDTVIDVIHDDDDGRDTADVNFFSVEIVHE